MMNLDDVKMIFMEYEIKDLDGQNFIFEGVGLKLKDAGLYGCGWSHWCPTYMSMLNIVYYYGIIERNPAMFHKLKFRCQAYDDRKEPEYETEYTIRDGRAH